jgi:hypothetical protein
MELKILFVLQYIEQQLQFEPYRVETLFYDL